MIVPNKTILAVIKSTRMRPCFAFYRSDCQALYLQQVVFNCRKRTEFRQCSNGNKRLLPTTSGTHPKFCKFWVRILVGFGGGSIIGYTCLHNRYHTQTRFELRGETSLSTHRQNTALLAICRPSGCTVASGVVVVVGVCNRSQMRTSKCTCLIFGVSIGLDPGQKCTKGIFDRSSSRSHATYRRPSLDGFYSFVNRANVYVGR